MIRVLVAEDSPSARALLVAILGGDPEIRIVGEARDGAEAVALTKRLRPDLVTMDIHMPGIDGFEATRQIMIEAPTPIVVVSATIDERGVMTSMHAMRAGALTVLPKPVGPASPGHEEQSRYLVSMVKAMAAVKVVRRWPSLRESRESHEAHEACAPASPIRVVAIGASTGGPAALHRLLTGLPGDFPVPILVVQHIADGFVAGLAAWLDTASLLRVQVAVPGARLAPRTVYLAPEHGHLGLVDRSTIAISTAAPIGGFRPSATFLFDSVARIFGAASLAVILTGMGDDGVEGLRAVRRAGGHVLAQDEESSVVFGMPRAAIAAGLAHAAVPLDVLAFRVSKVVDDVGRRGA